MPILGRQTFGVSVLKSEVRNPQQQSLRQETPCPARTCFRSLQGPPSCSHDLINARSICSYLWVEGRLSILLLPCKCRKPFPMYYLPQAAAKLTFAYQVLTLIWKQIKTESSGMRGEHKGRVTSGFWENLIQDKLLLNKSYRWRGHRRTFVGTNVLRPKRYKVFLPICTNPQTSSMFLVIFFCALPLPLFKGSI